MNRNIQGLRAIAAYGVVAHHVIFSLNHYIAHSNIPVMVGATGVDVFFVISGFIMADTTSKRPTTPFVFLLNRIIRIVPIYWLLTALTVSLLLCKFQVFGGGSSPGHVIRSLFFVPEVGVDPVIFVGWTLNYEMMFYAIFAICLFVSSERIRLALIIAAIVLLFVAGQLAPRESLLEKVGAPIILEFALGIVVWRLSKVLTPSTPVAIGMALCGLLCLIAPDLFTLGSKYIFTAPGAALIVSSALALEANGASIGKGWLQRQGDASYSIYLIHLFVLKLVGLSAIKVHLNASAVGLSSTIIAMFVMVYLVGTAFHRLVERKLTVWFRGLLHEGPPEGQMT